MLTTREVATLIGSYPSRIYLWEFPAIRELSLLEPWPLAGARFVFSAALFSASTMVAIAGCAPRRVTLARLGEAR
jgi:hypothetical protein